MIKKAAILGLLVAALAGRAWAQKDSEDAPQDIPHLDHVFVIMMENHGFYQVIGNPNEPYLNSLIANGKVNLAKNYFAVGHPSLTNYLEIVGGSNFGIRSDSSPSWHDATCTPNLQSGLVNADNNAGGNPPPPVPIETTSVCPISGKGKDAATPAIDNWNEISPEKTGLQFLFLADIDGVKSVPSAETKGETIADQLAHAGLTWKSYQENLPVTGADQVNYSNGTVSNLDFDANGNSTALAPLTSSSVVQDYAVKHNPFAYFQSVQEGTLPNSSLANIVGFDGRRGLYSDLASGEVPSLAFIAPNQCDDQHGRSNADAFCAFDFGVLNGNGLTNGTQVGLNPGLIQQGDVTIERLVKAIHASPAWHDGRAALVIVWDENDYSGSPAQSSGLFPPANQNKVVLAVQTNRDDDGGIQSNHYYNSFSLLKSLEAAFGLPCLNHACDPGVDVMSDLFGRDKN
jgi:phosphatidylinositol-3-phosphatase